MNSEAKSNYRRTGATRGRNRRGKLPYTGEAVPQNEDNNRYALQCGVVDMRRPAVPADVAEPCCSITFPSRTFIRRPPRPLKENENPSSTSTSSSDTRYIPHCAVEDVGPSLMPSDVAQASSSSSAFPPRIFIKRPPRLEEKEDSPSTSANSSENKKPHRRRNNRRNRQDEPVNTPAEFVNPFLNPKPFNTVPRINMPKPYSELEIEERSSEESYRKNQSMRGRKKKDDRDIDDGLYPKDGTDWAMAAQKVYYNDLIMRHIISYVTNMRDRVNVEVSTRRLCYLSHTAPWNFISPGSHFSLTYRTWSTCLTVELGDVSFLLPSLTLETRRDRLPEKVTDQDQRFVSVLNGMAQRFASGVRTARIGGSDRFDKDMGVRDHQLILTQDILMFMNDRFERLSELHLQECGIDQKASKYIASDEFTLPSRLSELSIERLWMDSDVDQSLVVKLISSSLKRLVITRVTTGIFPRAIVKRLNELPVLEEIRMTLIGYPRMDSLDMRTYVRGLSKRGNQFRLRILDSGHHCQVAFEIAQDAVRIPNLEGLAVLQQPRNRSEFVLFNLFLQGLSECSSLESLSLGGFTSVIGNRAEGEAPRNMLREQTMRLYDALSPIAHRLKEFAIIDLPKETDCQLISMMIGMLPTSLEGLRLGLKKTNVDDSTLLDMMERFTCMKKLKLGWMSRISSRCIYLILCSLPHLEEFDCEIPVDVQMVNVVGNATLLPKLKKTRLMLTTSSPSTVEQRLKGLFANVLCKQGYGSRRHTCSVIVETRLPEQNNSSKLPSPSSIRWKTVQTQRVPEYVVQQQIRQSKKEEWDAI